MPNKSEKSTELINKIQSIIDQEKKNKDIGPDYSQLSNPSESDIEFLEDSSDLYADEIEEICKLIQDLETNINFVDEMERTSLTLASSIKSKKVSAMIITMILNYRGEEIDLGLNRSGDGFTPLIFAVKVNSEEAIKILLSRDDVEIDEQDNKGFTALMHAASQGGKTNKIAKMLVRRGANINIVGDEGATALSIALDKNAELTKIFLSSNNSQKSTTNAELDRVFPLNIKNAGEEIISRKFEYIPAILRQNGLETFHQYVDNFNLTQYLFYKIGMDAEQELQSSRIKSTPINIYYNDMVFGLSMRGDKKLVDELIARVGEANKIGIISSAIYGASCGGHRILVNDLMEEIAKCDIQKTKINDRFFYNIIKYAAISGCEALVYDLITQSVAREYDTIPIMHHVFFYAARGGNKKLLDNIAKKITVDFNLKCQMIFGVAAGGHKDWLDDLIKQVSKTDDNVNDNVNDNNILYHIFLRAICGAIMGQHNMLFNHLIDQAIAIENNIDKNLLFNETAHLASCDFNKTSFDNFIDKATEMGVSRVDHIVNKIFSYSIRNRNKKLADHLLLIGANPHLISEKLINNENFTDENFRQELEDLKSLYEKELNIDKYVKIIRSSPKSNDHHLLLILHSSKNSKEFCSYEIKAYNITKKIKDDNLTMKLTDVFNLVLKNVFSEFYEENKKNEEKQNHQENTINTILEKSINRAFMAAYSFLSNPYIEDSKQFLNKEASLSLEKIKNVIQNSGKDVADEQLSMRLNNYYIMPEMIEEMILDFASPNPDLSKIDFQQINKIRKNNNLNIDTDVER